MERRADTMDNSQGSSLLRRQGQQQRRPRLAAEVSFDRFAGDLMAIAAGAMFGNLEELLDQLGLLQNAELIQRFPIRTQLREFVNPGVVHLLRRKERPGVTEMPGLSAAASFLLLCCPQTAEVV